MRWPFFPLLGVVDMIRVTSDPFELMELVDGVRRPEAGAIVLFLGTVRSTSELGKVKELFMDSYVDMAERELVQIAEEAKREFGILEVSIVHRIGRLVVGDDIVGIAVSGAHRKEAYAASRFIIDELKIRTALWKKEIGERGERWIEEGNE